MNSMHGFWVALAKRAGASWFHARWWPYWDAGIPFEFTYAPLIPAWTALWASVGGICWEARRLYLVAVWDDTPHLAALALLPLVIVLIYFSIEKRRFIYYAVTAVLIALTTSASMFGPAIIAMAALCLLFVMPRQDFKDFKRIEQYLAALDDPSLPFADFRWEGRNRIRIRSAPSDAQVISIQVSYHPGWRANIAGQPRQVRRDGLGLMWLKPECSGPCEVQLDYDGGWELRICGTSVSAPLLGCFLFRSSPKAVASPGLGPRKQCSLC